MADKQQRFALMSIFKKRLKEKNLRQDMNLYSQQWAADALIESYGYDQCLNIIDYYNWDKIDSKFYSLNTVVNNCSTPMGKRMLKQIFMYFVY